MGDSAARMGGTPNINIKGDREGLRGSSRMGRRGVTVQGQDGD